MLKALLDSGEDYLGIFQPFLLEVIGARSDPAFTASEVQASVATCFSLTIPETTLRVLLGRLVRGNLLRREGGRFIRRLIPERLGIASARANIEAEHQFLGSEFVTFAKERSLELASATDALELLFELVDDYQQEVLLNGQWPALIEEPHQDQSQHRRHLATLFLAERCVRDERLSAILRRILEGTVLGSTLLLKDIDAAKKDFKRLQVFLDTSLLLGALGYCGAAPQNLTRETLKLLQLANARTLVFDVTIAEIRRILAVYRDKLLTQTGREQLRPTELTRHFLTNRVSSADVAQAMAELPQNLKALGIGQVALPRRQRDYQLDETALQRMLTRPGGAEDEPRVLHDVDCVMGVINIRRGAHAFSWEESGAVFTSTTNAVVRQVDGWFRGSGERGMSPIVHTSKLANIAWLKNPKAGAELKQRELVALCSAALRPTENRWRLFLSHLGKLEQMGTVTSDEAVAVLASELTDQLLGEVEPDEDLDAETVAEVIERVKAEYRREADALVEDARKRQQDAETARTAAEQALQKAADEQAHRDAKGLARAGRASSWFSFLMCIVLGGLVIAAGLLGSSRWAAAFPAWARSLLNLGVILVGLLGVLSVLFGTSLASLRKWLQARVYRLLVRFFLPRLKARL
jgi:hypothetical protein